AGLVRDVVAGIEERGVLPKCDGVLSGYMGDAAIGEAVLEAAAKVRAANGRAQYCCDPVIGDVGRGVFVRPGIPEFMRDRAVKAADVITPNQFELNYLSGSETTSLANTLQAIDKVHATGPKTILVTSVHIEDTPKASIDLIASGAEGKFRLRTPLLEISVNGAGDAIAALFFFHLLKTNSSAVALSNAASSIFGLMKRTKDANSREILLVAAQEEFADPSNLFRAEKI
ncbi:MAG: pyridoxal kinase, partial [Rhizobiales bacterium]|nr:pyridoxal kinase [Hyphomicrobiales bacterium]